MLSAQQIPRTNLLELVVNGVITPQDYDRVAELVLLLLKERRQIRVLKEVRRFGRIHSAAMGETIRRLLPEMDTVERAALVADQSWIEEMANFVAPVFPCPVRYFRTQQKAEAIAWLKVA